MSCIEESLCHAASKNVAEPLASEFRPSERQRNINRTENQDTETPALSTSSQLVEKKKGIMARLCDLAVEVFAPS